MKYLYLYSNFGLSKKEKEKKKKLLANLGMNLCYQVTALSNLKYLQDFAYTIPAALVDERCIGKFKPYMSAYYHLGKWQDNQVKKDTILNKINYHGKNFDDFITAVLLDLKKEKLLAKSHKEKETTKGKKTGKKTIKSLQERESELKNILDARAPVTIGLGIEPTFKAKRIQSIDVIKTKSEIESSEEKRMIYSAAGFSMLGAFTRN
ncbi:hypothetical protein [Colwellia piezophila]|uniref:hypothetical protein n=1 Tax=Colwellia piezophila TaxID=211668 RepID=UPI00035EEE38|nr:hypothetical protein [Colwellia piezophila]